VIKKGWGRVAGATSALLWLACIFRTSKARRKAQAIAQGPEPIFEEFDRLTQELGHEIRNPLTAITARLHNLQRKLPLDSAEYKEAALIANEIRRLDTILQDFRYRGAPSVLHRAPVDAGVLLDNIRVLFAAGFDPEQITMRCEVGPQIQIMADPELLKQALINLVKNAAESIEQGKDEKRGGRRSSSSGPRGLIVLRVWRRSAEGAITAKNAPARSEAETEPKTKTLGRHSAVVFEVVDNGPGVPESVRARLLEPFFSTKERGTGLGLPIAARIVAQHGGQLEFESEPGHGATFRVVLPDPEDVP
jgi:signal transduction histidine kinase